MSKKKQRAPWQTRDAVVEELLNAFITHIQHCKKEYTQEQRDRIEETLVYLKSCISQELIEEKNRLVECMEAQCAQLNSLRDQLTPDPRSEDFQPLSKQMYTLKFHYYKVATEHLDEFVEKYYQLTGNRVTVHNGTIISIDVGVAELPVVVKNPIY